MNPYVEREILQKQLEETQKKIKELESLTESQRLAEFLHDIMCHWNHTDGCGWYYYSWTKWNNSSMLQADKYNAKTEYHSKAVKMLRVVPFDTCVKLVTILKDRS